jgi:hypothetical protein
MRWPWLSALALGALTSAALAEQPLTLSDDQMDKITGGSGYSSIAGQGWVGTASQINDAVSNAGAGGYNNAGENGGLGQQGNIPGSGPGAGRSTAAN